MIQNFSCRKDNVILQIFANFLCIFLRKMSKKDIIEK